jgi:hypothetical protein
MRSISAMLRKLQTFGPARGIADRAAQVAVVANLDECQTRVLLVIRAQPAVVRATPFHRRVVALRHLRRLDEHFPAAPVVVHIVSDQDALMTVFGAVLEHEDAIVLEDDLRVDAPIARRTDRDRDVVEQIRTRLCGHRLLSALRGEQPEEPLEHAGDKQHATKTCGNCANREHDAESRRESFTGVVRRKETEATADAEEDAAHGYDQTANHQGPSTHARSFQVRLKPDTTLRSG